MLLRYKRFAGAHRSCVHRVLDVSPMLHTARVKVKGVTYYEADKLYRAGKLQPGDPITLTHERENRYDKNAVAVSLSATGAKLGHMSRDIAPKYAMLVDCSRIRDAKISDVAGDGRKVNDLGLAIAYFTPEPDEPPSRLLRSISAMPRRAGVYAIIDTRTGRQYIGSALDLRGRLSQHTSDLETGCHHNGILQAAYRSSGASVFEAVVVDLLSEGCGEYALRRREREVIAERRAAGIDLFNRTDDGEGRRPRKEYELSEPAQARATAPNPPCAEARDGSEMAVLRASRGGEVSPLVVVACVAVVLLLLVVAL